MALDTNKNYKYPAFKNGRNYKSYITVGREEIPQIGKIYFHQADLSGISLDRP
jgi:hypothetical protein